MWGVLASWRDRVGTKHNLGTLKRALSFHLERPWKPGVACPRRFGSDGFAESASYGKPVFQVEIVDPGTTRLRGLLLDDGRDSWSFPYLRGAVSANPGAT